MALDRLLNQLNNSGLQQQNMQLFQVISRLIKELQKVILAIDTGSGGGGGGGGTTVNNFVTNNQFLDLLGDSDGGGSGDMGPPGLIGATGAAGADGANGMVPYFIAFGETFTVPEFKQALFEMTIDNEGILEVDGFLIQVD